MCMPVTMHRDQRPCTRWYPVWILGIDIRLPRPSASSSHPQPYICYICDFGGWRCVSGSWYLLLVQSAWAHIPVPTPGVQPSPTQYQVILCPLPASLGTKHKWHMLTETRWIKLTNLKYRHILKYIYLEKCTYSIFPEESRSKHMWSWIN